MPCTWTRWKTIRTSIWECDMLHMIGAILKVIGIIVLALIVLGCIALWKYIRRT